MPHTSARFWQVIVLGAITVAANLPAAELPTVKSPAAKSPVTSAPRRDDDPLLAPWHKPAAVRPVDRDANRHSMHTYYLSSPESPDGRFVVYYTSNTPDGQQGELRIVDRSTGDERVVSQGLVAEDAHRVACQQWLSQGKRVVFHTLRGETWLVKVVDLDTGRERVLAKDRLLGIVNPHADLVPIYGRHWNPGDHRDLEFVNAETGEIRTVVTAAAVKEKYPDWIQKEFGGHDVSIFFPVLSPNSKRIFWKIASPAGGDFRSKKASHRQGIVCYDLEQSQFLFLREKWGHPAWQPDSQAISEMGNLLLDAGTGATRRFLGAPYLGGEHPSISPDGKLFVKDGPLDGIGGAKGQWGIVVGRLDGGGYTIVHRFDQSQGARSWRRSHPHPSFSPDGRRIYFNTSSTPWTRLFVAEAAAGK